MLWCCDTTRAALAFQNISTRIFQKRSGEEHDLVWVPRGLKIVWKNKQELNQWFNGNTDLYWNHLRKVGQLPQLVPIYFPKRSLISEENKQHLWNASKNILGMHTETIPLSSLSCPVFRVHDLLYTRCNKIELFRYTSKYWLQMV